MELVFTPEQDQLRAAARDLLERHAPEEASTLPAGLGTVL
jgi:hypothetical protein